MSYPYPPDRLALYYITLNYLQERQRKSPSKKEQGGESPTGLTKPEEQEGMPQHQHYPLAKRREDRNKPEYHEEQQKDVA
jgi:hypothetical protein